MVYVSWMIVGLLALVAIVMFLFLPGLGVLAALALAAALVIGVLMLVARGTAGAGDTTPDIIERREEHEARRRGRSG